HKIEYAMLACNLAHFHNRVDQSPISRDVGDSNKLHTVVDGLAQYLKRDLPMRIVRNDLDRRTRFLSDLQEGDVVAGILCHGCKDAIPRFKRDGVEGHVPGASCIFNDGDLIARTTYEHSNGIIDMFNGVMRTLGCFITPDLRLKLQVSNGGVKNWPGH